MSISARGEQLREARELAADDSVMQVLRAIRGSPRMRYMPCAACRGSRACRPAHRAAKACVRARGRTGSPTGRAGRAPPKTRPPSPPTPPPACVQYRRATELRAAPHTHTHMGLKSHAEPQQCIVHPIRHHQMATVQVGRGLHRIALAEIYAMDARFPNGFEPAEPHASHQQHCSHRQEVPPLPPQPTQSGASSTSMTW